MVIADEVYAHLTFGSTPYVQMGSFGSIVPVLSLGSISKRWIVPGWRIGWLVAADPNGILQKSGVGFFSTPFQNKLCHCLLGITSSVCVYFQVIDSIVSCLNLSADPATFIQVCDS